VNIILSIYFLILSLCALSSVTYGVAADMHKTDDQDVWVFGVERRPLTCEFDLQKSIDNLDVFCKKEAPDYLVISRSCKNGGDGARFVLCSRQNRKNMIRFHIDQQGNPMALMLQKVDGVQWGIEFGDVQMPVKKSIVWGNIFLNTPNGCSNVALEVSEPSRTGYWNLRVLAHSNDGFQRRHYSMMKVHKGDEEFINDLCFSKKTQQFFWRMRVGPVLPYRVDVGFNNAENTSWLESTHMGFVRYYQMAMPEGVIYLWSKVIVDELRYVYPHYKARMRDPKNASLLPDFIFERAAISSELKSVEEMFIGEKNVAFEKVQLGRLFFLKTNDPEEWRYLFYNLVVKVYKDGRMLLQISGAHQQFCLNLASCMRFGALRKKDSGVLNWRQNGNTHELIFATDMKVRVRDMQSDRPVAIDIVLCSNHEILSTLIFDKINSDYLSYLEHTNDASVCVEPFGRVTLPPYDNDTMVYMMDVFLRQDAIGACVCVEEHDGSGSQIRILDRCVQQALYDKSCHWIRVVRKNKMLLSIESDLSYARSLPPVEVWAVGRKSMYLEVNWLPHFLFKAHVGVFDRGLLKILTERFEDVDSGWELTFESYDWRKGSPLACQAIKVMFAKLEYDFADDPREGVLLDFWANNRSESVIFWMNQRGGQHFFCWGDDKNCFEVSAGAAPKALNIYISKGAVRNAAELECYKKNGGPYGAGVLDFCMKIIFEDGSEKCAVMKPESRYMRLHWTVDGCVPKRCVSHPKVLGAITVPPMASGFQSLVSNAGVMAPPGHVAALQPLYQPLPVGGVFPPWMSMSPSSFDPQMVGAPIYFPQPAVQYCPHGVQQMPDIEGMRRMTLNPTVPGAWPSMPLQ